MIFEESHPLWKLLVTFYTFFAPREIPSMSINIPPHNSATTCGDLLLIIIAMNVNFISLFRYIHLIAWRHNIAYQCLDANGFEALLTDDF